MRVVDIDYISLTDLTKYQNEDELSGVIRNWMSNKNSLTPNRWKETLILLELFKKWTL